MLPRVSKHYVELVKIVEPWIEFVDDKLRLREDAPQEVKDADLERKRIREKTFLNWD